MRPGRKRTTESRVSQSTANPHTPATMSNAPSSKVGLAWEGISVPKTTRTEPARTMTSIMASTNRSARIVPNPALKGTRYRVEQVGAIGVAELGRDDRVGEIGQHHDLSQSRGRRDRKALGLIESRRIEHAAPPPATHEEGAIPEHEGDGQEPEIRLPHLRPNRTGIDVEAPRHEARGRRWRCRKR